MQEPRATPVRRDDRLCPEGEPVCQIDDERISAHGRKSSHIMRLRRLPRGSNFCLDVNMIILWVILYPWPRRNV